MNVHDWTRVPDSTFHDFHGVWIAELRNRLNKGLLPAGYYAQSEQHAGRPKPDMLALHTSDPDVLPVPPVPTPNTGAVAVADAPPRGTRSAVIEPTRTRRRTLTVRHTSGHRIIALVEVVSPGNRNTRRGLSEFVGKIGAALRTRIHVTVADVFPPGRLDPNGLHAAICADFGQPPDDGQRPPTDMPLTFASYAADAGRVEAVLNDFAVGDPVPDVPLFLTPDHYVTLPFAAAYADTYDGTPAYWRDVLEGRATHPPG